MTYFLRLLTAASLCLIGIHSSLADSDLDLDLDSQSSSSSGSLRRRTTPADDEYGQHGEQENEIVAAVAAAKSDYDQLAKAYMEEGCDKTWGKLPTALDPNPPVIGEGNLCKCGMLHDLAAAHIATEQDESYAAAVAANSGGKVTLSVASGGTETSLTTTARAKLKADLDMSEQQISASAEKVDSWLLARTANGQTACSNTGSAAGYPCRNVDLVAHMPFTDFRYTNSGNVWGIPSGGNDLWGWTHADSGREFLIWGVRQGHYFVEVTNDNPIVLGFLPSTDNGSSQWHDVKVIGDFAYMGSEIEWHGMQVFDLRQLVTFDPSNCLDSRYCRELSPETTYYGPSGHRVFKSHNIVVNEDSNYVYIVGGGNGCNGGLHVVDVSNPSSPGFAGCFGSEGYVHDAQCVNYNGPDSEFKGTSEICFCYNAYKIVIVDVTNKNNMQRLSTITYAKTRYTHQGWLSSDHTHIVFGDEQDELVGAVSKTRSIVVNVEDLRNPGNIASFLGRTRAIDHNQYIADYKSQTKGSLDLIYQSNYQAGLQILQAVDYNTADFHEVGYFDIYPRSTTNSFGGAWSVYPYFPSGLVAISGMGEGLFLVKPNIPDSELVGDSCYNDDNFKFRDDPTKTCGWIANNQNRVNKLCPRKNNGVLVSASCPETCNTRGASCPACEDNENFRFRDDPKKTCGWIATNQNRVNKLCPRKNNGVLVSKSCPEACDSRDASCPAV